MITAEQIAPLRGHQVDYEETEILKGKLAHLRQRRKPLYLTIEEFEEILEWKLGQQIGRQRKLRAANNDEIIKAVTGVALAIDHPNKEYELELRFGILCSLRGVAIPVASAILALIFPEEYAVVDFRVWRQLFGARKDIISISDYKKYMREIKRLSEDLNWLVQEVDHAIWEYDRRYGKD